MKYRSPRYNAVGSIDIELYHPEFGWIPFTASPDDPEEYGRQLYDQILAAGNIEPYEPA
ncbi:hypothetical protein [Bordetella genomosp. 7]|uniref:hypothetical protein n=1 Tax=Bordetella genomosp. 7 TaxID=1416805 RepID=UPI0014834776|nr:hypothetical protein [Bordetella genomosp. 7]